MPMSRNPAQKVRKPVDIRIPQMGRFCQRYPFYGAFRAQKVRKPFSVFSHERGFANIIKNTPHKMGSRGLGFPESSQTSGTVFAKRGICDIFRFGLGETVCRENGTFWPLCLKTPLPKSSQTSQKKYTPSRSNGSGSSPSTVEVAIHGAQIV